MKKTFWDRTAKIYDRFMRKDAAAYERLYELLRPVVRHKTVLELATGTGSIAKNIVSSVNHIEATDASSEMIAEARRDNQSAKRASWRRSEMLPIRESNWFISHPTEKPAAGKQLDTWQKRSKCCCMDFPRMRKPYSISFWQEPQKI